MLPLILRKSQNELKRLYNQQNSAVLHPLRFSIHRAFWGQVMGTELTFSFNSIIYEV